MFRSVALLIALLFFHPLQAMEFSVERHDLRPIMQPTLHITATGEIRAGDTEKLKAAMSAADVTDVRDVTFIFNSPGGSLIESIDLGEFIADIPAIVSAQVGSSDMPGAICASACVYAYIAADYRYLSRGARIGVHRFGFSEVKIDGNQGAAIGQALSGILSEYIRGHRVQPEFFEAISLIDHDDILWVPEDDLKNWRVVTNGVYDEKEEYVNINGKVGLRLSQIAITGDSFLTLFCTEEGISGLADLHEPELAAYGGFDIAIDGTWHTLNRWDVVDRTDMRGRVVFSLSPSLAQAARYAREFGARVTTPGQDLFFGFQQTIRKGLLSELIENCPGSRRVPGGVMVDQHRTDFPGNDLTSKGIRGISFQECKQICLRYEECQAVSYVQKQSWCWPKGSVTQSKYIDGIISAYRQ